MTKMKKSKFLVQLLFANLIILTIEENSDDDRFEAFSSGFTTQVDKVVKIINYNL